MVTMLYMPTHGDDNAPQFDVAKPWGLPHFKCTQITNQQACIYQAQRYLDLDEAEAIFLLYSGSEDEFKWPNADLWQWVQNSATEALEMSLADAKQIVALKQELDHHL